MGEQFPKEPGAVPTPPSRRFRLELARRPAWLWFAIALAGQVVLGPWIAAFARVATTRHLYEALMPVILALSFRLVRGFVDRGHAVAVLAGVATGYLCSVGAFLGASLLQAGGWDAFTRGIDKLGATSMLATTLAGSFMLLGWLIGGVCAWTTHAIGPVRMAHLSQRTWSGEA
jgi:hypothetical protein